MSRFLLPLSLSSLFFLRSLRTDKEFAKIYVPLLDCCEGVRERERKGNGKKIMMKDAENDDKAIAFVTQLREWKTEHSILKVVFSVLKQTKETASRVARK